MITQLLIVAYLTFTTHTSCPAAPKGNRCKNCDQSPFLLDNFCVSSCPLGYVAVKKKNNIECEYCDISKSLLPNPSKTQCVCALQHFITPLNGQCSPCHHSCLTCSGPNDNNCLTCSSSDLETFRKLTRQNQCVCKSGYTENPENPGLKCEPCHPDCKTCSGPEDDQCIECSKGKNKNEQNFCVCTQNFVSIEGNCECPAPYIVKNKKCLERESNCGPNQIEVAENPKNKNKKNTNVRNGIQLNLEEVQCVCRPGFNRIKNRCKQCGENEEFNIKSGKCECVKEATKFKKECIICPQNQKFNKRTGECNCKKNEQKTQDGSCIKCGKKEVYRFGECQCIKNYFRSKNGKCKKCNSKRDNPLCQVVYSNSDKPKLLERGEIE